jgi:LuxR family maltose regulon positive regulatory protein
MAISLLATKWHVPPPPPSLVHRQRLVALLDTGLQRKLTVVCAPAGYGKTTLLADWVTSSPSGRWPVAWLSLDAEDAGGRRRRSSNSLRRKSKQKPEGSAAPGSRSWC